MPAFVEVEFCGSKAARWKRLAFVTADGEVYIPAALAGPEWLVVQYAAWDGEKLLTVGKHTYVREDWVRREKPSLADALDVVKRRAREKATEHGFSEVLA
jgi:hypothetical protein